MRSEFELRHYARSADLLRAALEDERKPLTPELRSKVEHLRTRALAFVGRYTLELHPRTASVAVDGAARTLDSDGVLLLDAGEHRVVVTATGHATQVRTVDVVGGEETRMTVKLAPLVGPKDSASVPASTRPDAASTDVEDGRRTRRIWIAVSAVVIAVAGGVTAGVLASRGDDTTNSYASTTGTVFQGPQEAR